MESDSGVSRRGALRAGLTVLAGGLIATTARAQTDEGSKVEKSVVQYQYHPNADGSHCGICANFIAPESCKVVAGKIDPNGYCIAFAPKDSK